MCFSATASFAASAATGAAGVYSVSRVAHVREAPLGAMPLVFAVQQGTEGALWLVLQHHLPSNYEAPLANVFIACALIVWPVLAPAATMMVEPHRRRIAAMIFFLAAGLIAATYATVDTIKHPYFAEVTGRSLCYINNSPYPPALAAVYMLATSGALILSSHRRLHALGILIAIGLVASLAFYFTTFLSVWCFFAAGASMLICSHFLSRAGASLPTAA